MTFTPTLLDCFLTVFAIQYALTLHGHFVLDGKLIDMSPTQYLRLLFIYVLPNTFTLRSINLLKICT